MTSLQLSPRQQHLYDLFRRKSKQPLKELTRIWGNYYASGAPAKMISKNVTSLIHQLNASLKAAKKGQIVRISPRGRGHAGVYQLKKR